jgi:hypothetical protein
MSSSCPPASGGVANLYALASYRADMYSEVGVLCSAMVISDVNPLTNTATITAQCNSAVSDAWVSAVISSRENQNVITVSLDSPVPVNAGDTILLTITLYWS